MVTVSYLPSPGLSASSPLEGGQDGLGKIERSGVWLFLVRAYFRLSAAGDLGKERIVPHSVVGTPAFLVSLLTFVRVRHSCRATNWWATNGKAVLATASRCVEGQCTPDQVAVC